MCKFFSFAVKRDGTILTLLGEDRKKVGEIEADQHSAIADVFGVLEDETWKFEMGFSRDFLRRLKTGESLRDIFPDIRNCYDGGLTLEEFDEVCEQKTWFELAKLREKIIETAETLFKQPLLEQILGDLKPAQVVIELGMAREPEKLKEEIVGALKESRRGYLFQQSKDYEFSRLNLFHFENYGNISKIFVHRYVHTWADISETDMPIKHTELRVYVYPVAYTVKEGETVR